jgi:HK97 gp10 family phage protein
MARQTSRMEGAEEIAKVLEDLPTALEKTVLKQGVRAGAREIRDEAKDWAPSSGGQPSHPAFGPLEENIAVRTVPESQLKRYPAAAQVHNGDAYWGLFHEFGTSKMSAQPWLRPAAASAQGEATQAFLKTIFRGVKREAKKLAGKYGMLGKTRVRRLGRS